MDGYPKTIKLRKQVTVFWEIPVKHVKISAFDCTEAWVQILKIHLRTEGEVFKVGYGSEDTETKKLNTTIEILHPRKPAIASAIKLLVT